MERRAVDAETKQLYSALESCTLPDLNHEEHVRVAWYCAMQLPLDEGLGRLRTLLRRFAASKGAIGIYHETITCAFTCVVYERVARAPSETWSEFIAAHRDLVTPGFLEHYYPRHVLESEAARRTFLLPDPRNVAS